MNKIVKLFAASALFIMIVTGFTPLRVHAGPFDVSFAEKPEHAVLFIIDGLSYKVTDKMELPTLQKMIRTGAYIEKNYLPPAAHPHTGVYATLHTCSIPNPIMMAGTVFITKETEYLPQCFFPRKTTAFVANTLAYQSINRSYHYSYQKGSSDAESVRWALEFMKTGKPAFMRIHLQRPGGAGSQSMTTKNDVPWRNNIWAENSPYRIAVTRADSLLAEFIKGLDKLGVLEKTVLFVMGDHGQCDTGWHPLECIDASITTLVIWGAGVKSGIRIPYAELIDVTPTVCAFMEVDPPATCQGRTIVEALADYRGNILPRNMLIKEMLDQFAEYRTKMAEASYAVENSSSGNQGLLFTRLNRDIRAHFYDITSFTDWSQFASIEELLENNRTVMKKLDELIADVKKGQ